MVTRFGQFSSVAGPGLHVPIPFVNGLETYPIGIQRLQKDHLNTYTVDNQAFDRCKREMGKMNITQVAAHRGDVAIAVQKALTTDALDLCGIAIVDFQINDIRYTEQYRRGGDRRGESRTV